MPTAPPLPRFWQPDESGCLNLHFIADVQQFSGLVEPSNIHAWITQRPSYCDRGHWQFNVDGIPDVDWADGFPRYYMDLEIAKREAEAWLRWRLFKQP